MFMFMSTHLIHDEAWLYNPSSLLVLPLSGGAGVCGMDRRLLGDGLGLVGMVRGAWRAYCKHFKARYGWLFIGPKTLDRLV